MATMRIEKVSVVDQICDFIKQEIAEGTLKTGDKLEAEGKLAEVFGVNRFTVRLALQKLSTLGLIETKVGEGSFVKNASIKSYVREMQVFWGDNVREEHVSQLRNLIENDSVILASRLADEAEIAELKQTMDVHRVLFEEMTAGNTSDTHIASLVRADLKFHMQVVRMSHNHLYVEIYTMIQELVKMNIEAHIESVKNNVKMGIAKEEHTHKTLYEQIRSGRSNGNSEKKVNAPA